MVLLFFCTYILQTITLGRVNPFPDSPIPLNQTCTHTRIGRETMQHSADVLKELVLKFQLYNES